jgi:maltose alpha-D-glucosyltransferase/alpha-amylase
MGRERRVPAQRVEAHVLIAVSRHHCRNATVVEAPAARFGLSYSPFREELRRAFRELRGAETEALSPALGTAEQANKSIRYGNSLILKVYRRIEEGVHPELEMGRFLTEDRRPGCVAPLAGAIEYRRRRNASAVVAVLHGYVPNEGDALQYTLDVLSGFFERMATMPPLDPAPLMPLRRRLGEDGTPPPAFAAELLQGFLEMVRLLGKRLGELHRALASAPDRPDFAPEPVSVQYQRAIYQSLRNVLFDVQHDLEAEQVVFLPTPAPANPPFRLAPPS